MGDEWHRLHNCADFATLPRAHGPVLAAADFRAEPDDFRVTEHGVKPSGAGEHLFIRIRKTGQNTRWVAKRLAEALQVPYKRVSYAGLKDRHAVTEQWFSAHLPGQGLPDRGLLRIEGTEITELSWHERKLRPGELSYNHFQITLRNVSSFDQGLLEDRLRRIASGGVPNYFGPQRFGRERGNLELARTHDGLRRLNREQRAFALSALRGGLFNGYLANRVALGNWAEQVSGDVMLSDRQRGLAEQDQSVFVAQRLPSGLLWGQGAAAGTEEEAEWFDGFPEVAALLEAAGSRAARRVLPARVANLVWEPQDGNVRMEFALSPGSYATAVLREIFDLKEVI
jgi:tRNA pseudouridine13 synthase